MDFVFTPKGVCSHKFTISLQGNIVTKLHIHGGCSGNLQGISALVSGRTTSDVISSLEGITCGLRPTSCPDQIAKALKEALLEPSFVASLCSIT